MTKRNFKLEQTDIGWRIVLVSGVATEKEKRFLEHSYKHKHVAAARLRALNNAKTSTLSEG